MFTVKNAYKLRTVNDMPKACPVCTQRFMPEPGFYFGAVAMHTFSAMNWIVFAGFLEQPGLFLTAGVVTLIVILPPLWRLSRIIWIHMFVEFNRG